MIGYSSNLTIFVSGATTGRYTCTVSAAGYEPVQAAARVYARGPPAILNTPENSVQYGTLGETVQVEQKISTVTKKIFLTSFEYIFTALLYRLVARRCPCPPRRTWYGSTKTTQ